MRAGHSAWTRPWATRVVAASVVTSLLLLPPAGAATAKPVIYGRHWVAITGKPLAATAGARIFHKGGNAVDAAAAMLAATCTMWDTLGWGGETQALVYNPKTKKVIALNALGMAPTGATPEFYRSKGMNFPPEYGPLAAVTPGTPAGLIVMLAEWGTMSLGEVLAPAIEMADGYPIEAQLADGIERQKSWIKKWPYSKGVFLTHPGEAREAPQPGEIFKQADLAATLRKLVEAETAARKAGKSRREALFAAYDRFYKGDIAKELARGTQEQGGLITEQDLASWKWHLEEPVMTTYKGIEVYKLNTWVQGPMMLQALNILENADLRAMGYNSARYVHTLYQAMNLAFADRDFYYGDPYFPPEEPIKGLLSKDYAKARFALMREDKNDPDVRPGDPYPYQGGTNPFKALLDAWRTEGGPKPAGGGRQYQDAFAADTTSVEAADAEGWVVSMTPSGGWNPAVIAGRTGIGLSQRMQSFVLDETQNPYNVLEPGKRPRATLTPTLALKDGLPYLSFAVQGADTQEQNLLQFFLNVVEFGMNVQEATEAPNITSYQLRDSFNEHVSVPGKLTLNEQMPEWVRSELRRMGYKLDFVRLTSGPINAIYFDRAHGTFWGGSSNHGEDYGIGW
jgi:gamma-glutamyltranspeptidase/glutathione hydrolase